MWLSNMHNEEVLVVPVGSSWSGDQAFTQLFHRHLRSIIFTVPLQARY